MDSRGCILLVSIPVGTIHRCQIKPEVPNLPKELVLVDKPIGTVTAGDTETAVNTCVPMLQQDKMTVDLLWVTINEGNSSKVEGALDGRSVACIADKLRVIVPRQKR